MIYYMVVTDGDYAELSGEANFVSSLSRNCSASACKSSHKTSGPILWEEPGVLSPFLDLAMLMIESD